MIIGPPGVGKTTLARAAVARLGGQFDRVDWVTATAPTATIPFAAFSHLIEVPDTGKTAEVLRNARESLGDGRLLVVDDAHLLDKLSAALVHQLAVSGATKLIVAVAPNGPVAEEISALWEDDLLERIELQPAGHDDSRVATLVEQFVAALPATAHRVLEYLAVDDPLPLAQISELVSREAVAEAEVAGAVVVDDDQVRPAHPLFVDAVRDAMGGPELRRLRTELVERLGAAPPRDVVDLLRLAVLALDADRAAADRRIGQGRRGGPAARRPGAVRAARPGRAATRGRPARAAHTGLCARLAGPWPRRRFCSGSG